MIKYKLLTEKELEVISKKISHRKMNQQDYNRLSRFVRPKLIAVSELNAKELLNKLGYNQKAAPIENKIKNLLLEQLNNIDSIFIYGSAIQNNYTDYNDIDVLIITQDKSWSKTKEKYSLISSLTEKAKSIGLNLDIELLDKRSFYIQYPRNPSLIYQLKDSRLIYGPAKIPKKISLSKLDLRMKLDWSDIVDEQSEGNEIYHALRNTLLVRLLSEQVINNYQLSRLLIEQIGKTLITRLKNNTASKLERKLSLAYLKELTEDTDQKIINSKWEKITL